VTYTVHEWIGYAINPAKTLGGELVMAYGCAFVLLNYYEQGKDYVIFSIMNGRLTVSRRDDLYEMDFPAYDLKQIPVTQEMIEAIGMAPKSAYLGRDLLCVFENANMVKNLSPDLEKLKGLDGLLLQATAQADGKEYDCISRSFAPKMNVVEDPVCGSGHCHIIPYWAKELSQDSLTAYQASPRGGVLYCRMDGKRVIMAGKAALYSQAEIYVPGRYRNGRCHR